MNDSEDTRHLYSITWLASIYQIIFKNDLNRSWELTSWSIFWQFLDCDGLGVFVYAISILSSKWVFVLILCWEGIVTLSFNSFLSQLSEIVLVIVMLDHASFGLFTVVHRSLDLWLDHAHPRDNTLNLHKLVDKI